MGIAEHFVHFNAPRLDNLLTPCEGGSQTERSEETDGSQLEEVKQSRRKKSRLCAGPRLVMINYVPGRMCVFGVICAGSTGSVPNVTPLLFCEDEGEFSW